MDECDDGSRPIAGVWNFTDEYQARLLIYSPSENFIIGVLYPILFALGLVFNGAFLYVVFRIERMHTVTNIYLSHLACADIIYVGVTAAGVIACYVRSPIRFDNYFINTSVGCFLIVVPLFTTMVAAICIVTLVTFERYQAIVNPLGHRRLSSKSRTRKLLAGCWGFSFVLGTGVTLLYTKHVRYCIIWPEEEEFQHFPNAAQFCDKLHPDLVVFSELCKTVPFFVALVWSIYMYGRIIYALSSVDESLGKDEDGNKVTMQGSSRYRNQVARLLIVNGSIFFFCQIWTRIASIDAIVKAIFGEGILETDQYNAILSLSRGMLFVNGLINPFVYNATSSLYRQAFRDAFFVCKKRQENVVANSLSHNTKSSSL